MVMSDCFEVEARLPEALQYKRQHPQSSSLVWTAI